MKVIFMIIALAYIVRAPPINEEKELRYYCGNTTFFNEDPSTDLKFRPTAEVCCEDLNNIVKTKGVGYGPKCLIYLYGEHTEFKYGKARQHADNCHLAAILCVDKWSRNDYGKKRPVRYTDKEGLVLKTYQTGNSTFIGYANETIENNINLQEHELNHIDYEDLDENNGKVSGSKRTIEKNDWRNLVQCHGQGSVLKTNEIEKYDVFIYKDSPKWIFQLHREELCVYLQRMEDCFLIRSIDKNQALYIRQDGHRVNDEILRHCGWIDEDGEITTDYDFRNSKDDVKSSCPGGSRIINIQRFHIANKEIGPTTLKTNAISINGKQVILKVNFFEGVICYSEVCQVDVTGMKNGIKFKFLSSVGIAHIVDKNDIREEIFMGSTVIEYEFKNPGIHNFHGYCNNMNFRRKVVLTTNEYCDAEYPEFYYILNNRYCKESKYINRLLICLASFLFLYFLSDICAAAISSLISFIMTCIGFICLKKFYCMQCMKYKCGSGHKCMPTVCPYCNYDMGTNERFEGDYNKELVKHHMSTCRKNKNQNTFLACFKINYFVLYTGFNYIFRSIPRFSAGILILIIILNLIGGRDMKSINRDSANSFDDKIIEKFVETYNITELLRNEFKTTVEEFFNKALKNDSENNNKGFFNFYERITGKESKGFVCSLEFFSVVNSICAVLIIIAIFLRFANELSAEFYYDYLTYNKYRILCEKCFEFADEEHTPEICNGPVWCPVCKTGLAISWPKHENYQNNFFVNHVQNHQEVEKRDVWMNNQSMRMKSKGSKIIKNTLFLLFFFILFNMAACDVFHNKEMEKVEDDMSEFIKELEISGFHPYHARFTGGPREHLSSINEKKDCSKGKCTVTMEMESDMYIRPGREYGYTVQGKNIKNSIKMNVKIREPRAVCEYKNTYITGKVKQISKTTDTCTRSCDECHKDLETDTPVHDKLSTIHRMQHPDSSSWACDGPGCMSMGSGCTCLECWCELTSERWDVMELTKESSVFSICLAIANNGYCKEISSVEERNNIITILKYEQDLNLCPKIITCRNGICKTGLINKLEENAEKFGSVKLIGKFTTSSNEIRAQEICHFGKSRYYNVEKCCKDTYYLLDELSPVHFVNTVKDQKNVHRIEVMSLGAWKLRIKLPKLTYQEKIDQVKLTKGRIINCKGCHSCSEGGSCQLEIYSNFDHLCQYYCNECQTDSDHIQIKKGLNQVSFNVFCKTKEGNLNCTIMDVKVSGKYTLKEEPHVPHGDGEINIDVYRHVDKECDTFFCGLGLGFMDLLGKIKYIIVAVFFIIVLLIVIYGIYKCLK